MSERDTRANDRSAYLASINEEKVEIASGEEMTSSDEDDEKEKDEDYDEEDEDENENSTGNYDGTNQGEADWGQPNLDMMQTLMEMFQKSQREMASLRNEI